MNAAVSLPRPLPSRRLRRRTVVLYAVGLLLVTLASALALAGLDAPRSPALRAAFGVGALLTLYGAARLALSAMQGLQTRRGGVLDERQQARVTQAMAASYRAVSLLLFGLVTAFTVLSPAAPRLVQPGSLGNAGVIFALAFLLAALPSAILAWTEPDPDV